MTAAVLVIDAEPTVRTVVSNILGKAGFSVRATEDFQNAVEMLREQPADIVLTNVCLKGIPAHDAMFRLKELFPHMPVLMVSGLPDEDVISEWRGKDGFDVFPKPFHCADLVAKVREMLSDHGSNGHVPDPER